MIDEKGKVSEPWSAAREKYVGKSVNRIEDPGLVTGSAEFIDNFSLPGMLHCAILRSPYPHARIVKIDTSAAVALEGVVAVLTGEDVERWSNPVVTAPEGWGTHCLAVKKVIFVGEPVAAVAATNRYIAEDALELIQVKYEPLTPVSDPYKAMASGSPLLFDQHSSNVILKRTYDWGDTDKAFSEASLVVRESFRWNRVGANPMETFGCVCIWDSINNGLTCYGSFQTPRFIAIGRAVTLNLAVNRVNVISHPQGGGFGGKGGPRSTDIAALLSRKAEGRPVKYIEDRMEYLLAGAGQSWDRYYDGALAIDANGRVRAFDLKMVDDQGAGAEGYGTISSAKPLAAFTGSYTIDVARYDVTLVATNRAPTYPYRGYGPPPHYFVLESLMDVAARKLGIDPAEFRRRNFIRPEQFPYTIASGNQYDSGNYEAALDKVLAMADYQSLREEQRKARAEGRYLGIGVVTVVEPGVFDWNCYATVGISGVGVPEGVKVSVDIFGTVTVVVGFNLQGQGQYTVAAQVVADYFGIDIELVRVTMAPTIMAAPSFGPGGSRLGVAVSGAVQGACRKIDATFRKVVAHLMQVDAEQLELADGQFRLKQNPSAGMTIAQVAGTMLTRSDLLPPGVEPCTEATFVWTAPDRTAPDAQGRCKSYLTAANAAHVALVEVDPRTGQTKILRYFVVDDCGTRLNPASVEGQLQGGIAQGVGAALYEQYVYDDQGQPLVSTFVDYLIPTIHEVPMTEKGSIETPSPFTPFGAKGCGEGAIHSTPALLMCAINDALAPLGISVRETPASPHRLWKLIRESSTKQT